MVLLHRRRAGFDQPLCHASARPDALGHIYGVAPEVVANAEEYFRGQLRHLDVALSDGRRFLMGDKFTSADILLATCLDWAIAGKAVHPSICHSPIAARKALGLPKRARRALRKK